MKRHRYLWILVGLLAFASLACNAFAGEPLEPTLPRPDLGGSGDEDTGDVAGGTAGLPTAVIQNIAPTATLAGGLPPTATPIVAEPVDGNAVLRALVDVNIRMGPGVAYGRDSFLFGGETAVVLGRHAESGWWKIVCPERSDGNVCWVSGGSQYTSVSNAGAAQSVAAPPTPTAEPTIEATAVSDSSASSTIADTTETETLSSASEFGLVASGAQMVYADEDALWLLPLDEVGAAEPTWLAEAENVSDVLISPNGRYVAYLIVADMDASLNLVDIVTGTVQTLVNATDLAEMASSSDLAVLTGQFQWLADSETIAFNTYAIDRTGGPGVGNQEDLWTVDLTGALTERFSAGEGGGTFAISADDVVILGQTTAVVRANLDGSNYETVIDFDFVNTASEFAFYPRLQWTENGAAVAISSPDPYPNAEAELWRIPAAGEAESLASLEGNIIFSPVIWSDSGRQLGYVREMVGSEAALVVGTGDGADTADYADDASRFFGWSPVERHFVYAGQGKYAIGQLDEQPLVVELSEGRTAVSTQWLNDNAFIIALGSGENWDFRLQTIEGPATRLVSGSSTPLFDVWIP